MKTTYYVYDDELGFVIGSAPSLAEARQVGEDSGRDYTIGGPC